MTKYKILLPLLLSMLLLFSGCFGGNTSSIQRNIGSSELFTEADISNAMDRVTAHFGREFEGCTLLLLEYDEEHWAEAAAEWADQYETDEAIVLTSTFTVDASGGDGSLNPGQTYTGWQWILTRPRGGSWELRTWGYG